MTTSTPTYDHDHDQEEEYVTDPAVVTIDNAIHHLNQMQKLFVDNDAIFSQINALYSAVTSNKISIEINKKNKQSTISDFFNPCQNE